MNRNWVDNFTMYSFLKFYFGMFFFKNFYCLLVFVFLLLLTSFSTTIKGNVKRLLNKKPHPKKNSSSFKQKEGNL